MSLRLPENEQANAVLADFLLTQNAKNDEMIANYTASNLFVSDHPVLDYAGEMGISH